MMEADEGLSIGEKLKRARSREALEIRDVEERTKIRIKYLRALENEEWDVLPSPAYAKGFLRTYAQAVGLDADALVDEYRRTVETAEPGNQSYVLGEPVLETRRRLGDRSPWGTRAVAIAAIAAAIVGGLLILGLTEDDEPKDHGKRHRAAKNGDGKGHKGHSGGGKGASGPVNLSVTPLDTIELCLVPGHGAPKIDGQIVQAGQRQPGSGVYTADRFRFDLYSGGKVNLDLDGHKEEIKTKRRASYEISAAGVSPTDFAGQNCR